MDLATAFIEISRHRAGNGTNSESSQESSNDHLRDTVCGGLYECSKNSGSVSHDDRASTPNFHGKRGNHDGGEEGCEVVSESNQ